MMSLASALVLGFLLGLRHAAEPDHVLAVATIVSRQRSVLNGALVGALWGIGHAVTILGVGSAILVFGLAVSPRVGLTLELAVAAMLVVLGITALVAPTRRAASHDPSARPPRARTLKPLLIGIVHGLAGSASIVLLVMIALPDPFWAGVYVVVFGVGTIAGMMMLTVCMSWPLVRFGRRSVALQQRVAAAAGVLSIVLGLVLAYQLGVAALLAAP